MHFSIFLRYLLQIFKISLASGASSHQTIYEAAILNCSPPPNRNPGGAAAVGILKISLRIEK